MIGMRATRIVKGHARLFAAAACGAVAAALLPNSLAARQKFVGAWDCSALLYLLLIALLFTRAQPAQMRRRAAAEDDAAWTLFFLVLAGAVASFAAILAEFGSIKAAPDIARGPKVLVVAATLALSWLITQAVFALRYAHEFYGSEAGAEKVDGGLIFPDEDCPDYWDFFYFSAVLGMTFQVSDVQIVARKLRRLATLHGLLGFVFNTVIIALTVNLASGLL